MVCFFLCVPCITMQFICLLCFVLCFVLSVCVLSVICLVFICSYALYVSIIALYAICSVCEHLSTASWFTFYRWLLVFYVTAICVFICVYLSLYVCECGSMFGVVCLSQHACIFTGSWVMGAGGGLGRGWVGKDLYYDRHGLSDIAKPILCLTDPMVSRYREYHQCGTSELVILTSLTNFNG